MLYLIKLYLNLLYMSNPHCYSNRVIYFKEGLFDKFVDCTYILLLEGSDREREVYKKIT